VTNVAERVRALRGEGAATSGFNTVPACLTLEVPASQLGRVAALIEELRSCTNAGEPAVQRIDISYAIINTKPE
jgi:hypothetical protein